MNTKLLHKSQFVKFLLDIEDEYILPEFVGNEKYSLPVMFLTSESGTATHVSFSVFTDMAHIIKYSKSFYQYIQIGAEAHSIIHWLNSDQIEAIKQDQQLLN